MGDMRIVGGFLGRKHTEWTKKKMSEAQKGENHPFFGRKHTEETRRKLSEALIGGKGNFFGKKHTEGARKKMSESHKGENHPNWKGGISFEPYGLSFNRQLKDRVRVRDNFICQLCRVPELECRERLCIHHIDYNKKNCQIDNLISLCRRCNSKVNAHRNFWALIFRGK